MCRLFSGTHFYNDTFAQNKICSYAKQIYEHHQSLMNSTNKMSLISFQIIHPDDRQAFLVIAGWYFSEWHIPAETTIKRLQSVTADKGQFQALMTFEGKPIATGGIYNHVSLLDKAPGLKMHRKWLGLLYTIPDKRNQGYGASLCNYIHSYCCLLGFKKIHLFTHSAESFYQRLGWEKLEQLVICDRDIVIMEKLLSNDNVCCN